MQRVHFYVGENKSIGLRIHARDQAPFTIRDATWELKGNYETEAQGECEINGDVIRAMIAPQKRVTYRLYFTYKVAEEILMDPISIDHAKPGDCRREDKDRG